MPLNFHDDVRQVTLTNSLAGTAEDTHVWKLISLFDGRLVKIAEVSCPRSGRTDVQR